MSYILHSLDKAIILAVFLLYHSPENHPLPCVVLHFNSHSFASRYSQHSSKTHLFVLLPVFIAFSVIPYVSACTTDYLWLIPFSNFLAAKNSIQVVNYSQSLYYLFLNLSVLPTCCGNIYSNVCVCHCRVQSCCLVGFNFSLLLSQGTLFPIWWN